jgi:hypothetical protein
MSKVGTYKLTYNCVNKRSFKAEPAVRTIYVSDNYCPICHIVGDSVFTLEAGFAYTDQGAYFEDAIDGKITTGIQVSNPLADAARSHPGIYHVVYRAKDSVGNWNDGKCIGSHQCRRKVVVQDTLKPVIALSYGKETIHVSSASDSPVHDSNLRNPAVSHFLMAEQKADSSWEAWIIGSAVVGAVLVAYTAKGRQQSATEVADLV